MPPALAKLTLAPAALLESTKVWLLLSAELEFSFSLSTPWVEAQKEDGMLRWPWSSRLKHPVPRVLGGSCVTAAEIPTREGWERQGSSQTKTRRQLGCQHCKRTFHLPCPPRWHRQGEPQCRGAQAAGAGDEHLAGLRDHRSAPLTSPQSQSNDIAPSNARVTSLVVTAQSRLGCSVPMDAGLQCPHGCWPEVLGQEHTGVGVTVPHTGVQHLGQDVQTGTGRGYSSEGLQWGPRLHLR